MIFRPLKAWVMKDIRRLTLVIFVAMVTLVFLVIFLMTLTEEFPVIGTILAFVMYAGFFGVLSFAVAILIFYRNKK